MNDAWIRLTQCSKNGPLSELGDCEISVETLFKVSDVVAAGIWGKGAIPPPPKKMKAVRKLSSCSCRKRFVQNAKFRTENLNFRKFRGKIEILSTFNLLCEKFAAVCRQIATSCPA